MASLLDTITPILKQYGAHVTHGFDPEHKTTTAGTPSLHAVEDGAYDVQIAGNIKDEKLHRELASALTEAGVYALIESPTSKWRQGSRNGWIVHVQAHAPRGKSLPSRGGSGPRANAPAKSDNPYLQAFREGMAAIEQGRPVAPITPTPAAPAAQDPVASFREGMRAFEAQQLPREEVPAPRPAPTTPTPKARAKPKAKPKGVFARIAERTREIAQDFDAALTAPRASEVAASKPATAADLAKFRAGMKNAAASKPATAADLAQFRARIKTTPEKRNVAPPLDVEALHEQLLAQKKPDPKLLHRYVAARIAQEEREFGPFSPKQYNERAEDIRWDLKIERLERANPPTDDRTLWQKIAAIPQAMQYGAEEALNVHIPFLTPEGLTPAFSGPEPRGFLGNAARTVGGMAAFVGTGGGPIWAGLEFLTPLALGALSARAAENPGLIRTALAGFAKLSPKAQRLAIDILSQLTPGATVAAVENAGAQINATGKIDLKEMGKAALVGSGAAAGLSGALHAGIPAAKAGTAKLIRGAKGLKAAAEGLVVEPKMGAPKVAAPEVASKPAPVAATGAAAIRKAKVAKEITPPAEAAPEVAPEAVVSPEVKPAGKGTRARKAKPAPVTPAPEPEALPAPEVPVAREKRSYEMTPDEFAAQNPNADLDYHREMVDAALETGALKPEQARALGHFDAYPDLAEKYGKPSPAPAPAPVVAPEGKGKGLEVYVTPADLEAQQGWGNERRMVHRESGEIINGEIVKPEDLPADLYHVTTNLPAVEASGRLRSIIADNVAGLGKGTSKAHHGVSLTTSRDTAELIARELRRGSDLAAERAHLIKDLTRYAREDEAIAGLPEGTLQPAVDEARQLYDMWRNIAAKQGRNVPEGWHGYDAYASAYLRERERLGGPENPLLMAGYKAMRGLDSSKVGIVRVASRDIPQNALVRVNPLGSNHLNEVMVHSEVPIGGRVSEGTPPAPPPPPAPTESTSPGPAAEQAPVASAGAPAEPSRWAQAVMAARAAALNVEGEWRQAGRPISQDEWAHMLTAIRHVGQQYGIPEGLLPRLQREALWQANPPSGPSDATRNARLNWPRRIGTLSVETAPPAPEAGKNTLAPGPEAAPAEPVTPVAPAEAPPTLARVPMSEKGNYKERVGEPVYLQGQEAPLGTFVGIEKVNSDSKPRVVYLTPSGERKSVDLRYAEMDAPQAVAPRPSDVIPEEPPQAALPPGRVKNTPENIKARMEALRAKQAEASKPKVASAATKPKAMPAKPAAPTSKSKPAPAPAKPAAPAAEPKPTPAKPAVPAERTKAKPILSEQGQKSLEALRQKWTTARAVAPQLDADDLRHLANIGRDLFEAGVERFEKWAAQMVAHLPELAKVMKPHLREIYRDIAPRVRTARRVEGINLDRMEGPEDFKQFIEQTIQDNLAEVRAARRSPVTWEQTVKEAERLLVEEDGLTLDDIRRWTPGQPVNAATIEAVRGVFRGIADRFYRARANFLNNPTSENRLKMVREFQVYKATLLARTSATSEAARALNIAKRIDSALRGEEYINLLKTKLIKPPAKQPARQLAAVGAAGEGYGSRNRIFTVERYNAAKERALARISKLHAGIDPALLGDIVEIMGYHVEAGTREFAAVSKRILAELGQEVAPYLRKAWKQVREDHAEVFEAKPEEVSAPPTPKEQALREDIMQRMLKELGDSEEFDRFVLEAMQIPPDDQPALIDLVRRYSKPHEHWLHQAHVSNLLMGVRGMLIDAVSTAGWHAYSELITRPLAAGAEGLAARLGRRESTRTLREVFPAWLGTFAGLRAGFIRAANTLRYGYGEPSGAMLDLQPELPGGAKNPWNTMPRVRAALNEVQFSLAYASELYAEAARRAAREGQRGMGFARRVKALVENPTQDMMKAALEHAEYVTFTGKSRGLQALYGLQTLGAFELPEGAARILGRGKLKPLKVLMPFIRVFYNLVDRGFEVGPTGFLKLLNPEVRNNAHRASQVIANAAFGSLALGLLAGYASRGLITGPPATTPAKREQQYETRPPWSIRLGGKWVSYQNWSGPMQMLLAGAAAFGNDPNLAQDQPRILRYLANLAQSGFDLSMLRGLRDLQMGMDAMSGSGWKQAGERWLYGVGSGFVPAAPILRQVAQATDAEIKQPEGLKERFKTGIPGLSKQVPAKLTVFGQKTKRSGQEGLAAFSPITVRAETKDPVIRELARLGMAPGYVGKAQTIPRKQADRIWNEGRWPKSVRTRKIEELPRPEHRALQEQTGKLLHKVARRLITAKQFPDGWLRPLRLDDNQETRLARGGWKALSDDQKRRMLTYWLGRARTKARENFQTKGERRLLEILEAQEARKKVAK